MNVSSFRRDILDRLQSSTAGIKLALFSIVIFLLSAYLSFALPTITFVAPTLSNTSFTPNSWLFINSTIDEPQNQTIIEFNSQNYTIYEPSLVLNLPFEEVSGTTTYDNSPYGNNGTLYNGSSQICAGTPALNSTCPQRAGGRFGSGLYFDGFNDYVNAGNANALNITNAITIEVWVKPQQNTAHASILAKENYPGNLGYLLHQLSGTGWMFRLYNVTHQVTLSAANTVTLNEWQFIVAVSNGTTMTLYKNGTQIGTPIDSPAIIASTTEPLLIGTRSTVSAQLFNGSIDEVRIYNRSLSASEIAAHYNMSFGKYYANFTNISDGPQSYRIYAQNATGNWNTSETRTITVDTAKPAISFVSPADSDGAFISRNWTYINISASDANNITAFIDFNRSLVGWWRLNRESGENDTFVRDRSSYGNNGTIYNTNPGIDNCTGNCSGWTSSGKFWNALQFDGVNDYVSGTISQSHDVFTITAWIKISATGREQHFAEFGNTQFYVGSNNKLGTSAWSTAAGSKSLSKNVWYFASLVRSNTNVSLYLDGARDGTDGTRGTNPTNTFFIGDIYTLSGNYNFNGTIDEVKIWNRILSSEEINASYNSGIYRLYHNFTNLTDGTYTYTAYAQDLAGNVNQTETRTLAVDTTVPSYLLNNTNNTQAGKDTLFSLYWTDNSLSSYIFSFDNGTGLYVNESGPLTGTSNYTNMTKHVNSTAGSTIRWIVYANDTAGNTNISGTYSFTTTSAPSLFITMSLADYILNPDDAIFLNGQARDVNGTAVTGTVIDIYLDDERIDAWVDEDFTWWDYSWMYKDKAIINGSTSNLSDYSVSLVVNWTSGMNTAFDDLRFTYHNKTTDTESEVPYWIEKKYDSINATVWIRTGLTEGNNTVNIYYGNPDAGNESDGASVFDLFENWENGIVNTNYWRPGGSVYPYWASYTSTAYDGAYSSGNNDISDSQSSWIKRTISVSSQSILEFYWKVSSESCCDYLHYCIDNDACVYYNGYVSRIAGTVNWAEVNYTLPSGDHSIKFGYGKDSSVSTGSDTGWIDVIRTRKYTTPEPVIIAYETYNRTHWINATGGYKSVFKVPTNSGAHTLRISSTDQNGITGENTTEFTSRIYIAPDIHTASKGTRYAALDDEINISALVYRSMNGDIDSVWVNITDPDNQSYIYYLDNGTAKNETGTWYKIINVSTDLNNSLGIYNSSFYANDTTGMVSSIPPISFWFSVQTSTIDINLDDSSVIPFQTITVSGQSIAAQKTVYIIMNDTYNTTATTQLNDASSAKNITLNASQSRTEYIRLPKYIDVTSVAFDIKGYAYNNSYPRNPSVDIGGDNDNEFWGAGTYNGTLFLQDRFSDNLQLHNISFYRLDYDTSYIRLPKILSIFNATLNISGNTGPGFTDNASYNMIQNGDFENGTTWWTYYTAHRDTNATGIVQEGNYSSHVTSTLGSTSALWYPDASFKSSVRNKKKFYTMWYYPVDLTADYIDLPYITQSQVSGPQLCYFMPRNTTGNLYSKGGSAVSFTNPMNASKWYKIQLLCNPSVSESILWIDDVKIARATGPSYTESYVGIWLADPWVGNAGWGNAYLDNLSLTVDTTVFTAQNVTLNIGNDSDTEFNITGVFNSSNSPQKIEFRDEIISLTDSCNISIDSKGNVYCDVPVNVTSQSAGNVALTVLNVTYNYSSSTLSSILSDYKTAINTYLSSCTADQSGYCNVPIVFTSDSQGALEISNINITYVADYLGKTETDADGAYSADITAPKYPNHYNVSVFLFDSGVLLGSNMTNITVTADTTLTLISITTPVDIDTGKLLWSDYQQTWDDTDVNYTTSSVSISFWNSTGDLVLENASMSYNSTNSRWEYNYNLLYLGFMNFTVYANSRESVNGQHMVNQSASSYFDVQNISMSVDSDKQTYNPEENMTISGIAMLQPYMTNVSSNTMYISLDGAKLLYRSETGYIESGGTSNLATDGNGSYSYILKSPLESGTHTLGVNITNSNSISGVNTTRFTTLIAIRNEKAVSSQTHTTHSDINQMINISSVIYKNIDNPIGFVWVNVTLPDSATKTYYLDNTTSKALTGTWFKSLNVSSEFGNVLGQYNVTIYANSTLSNGSVISQQLPVPETSFYVDSVQTTLDLDKQPQIYGNSGNMTVSGNIILNTDNASQSSQVISFHVNNSRIGWCNGYNDSCISGNGYNIQALGGTWKYLKQMTIDNTGNPDSLHNYQVPVNITYNENMQTDFDDIRFTWYNYSSRQDMKIPYFIENKTDSSWAYVWMKIPYIPADSTTKIYLYYGNTTAINESNENATFILGDIEPLILNTEASWSSSYDPYNVNNHDTRAQSIYMFTDFIDSESVPFKITKLVYPAYQTPGQSLRNYRIRMQKTSITQNTGNFNASNWTVSWGPTTHSVTGGASYNYTLSSAFYWTEKNLLIDLSRDGTSYTSSGSMYVRTNSLTSRTCSYTSDSSRTWPFDGTCTTINYVPVVVFSGLLRNYSSPEPTVVSIGPEQQALLTDASGNYNYTIRPNITDGVYTIKVNITDINGIYSENETSFEVDNTQPDISIYNPDIDKTHCNYAPDITGICSDKNNVSYVGTNMTQYNTSHISAFNLTNISALPEQYYDVNITCNDTQGNQKSYVFGFTYDTKAPDISLVPQTDDDNSHISRDWTYVNVSVTDSLSRENQTALIDFNNTLVGWWRFNRETGENDTIVRDWSSYGNNGRIYNTNPGLDNCTGNCSGWTASGKFGKALKFDGINDYVDIPNRDVLNMNDNITVEAWVYPFQLSGHPASSGQFRIATNIQNNKGYYFYYQSSLRFAIGNGTNYCWDSSGKTISANQWTHIAATHTGTTTKWYMNGNLEYTKTNTCRLNSTSMTSNLAFSSGSPDFTWNGTIDEVRIYSRALSEEEINASYNTGIYRLYHNFTGLADGTYTYTAYAQDLAGNVNQTETRTLTIDTTPPEINISTPLDGTIYTTSSIYFNATCINEPCSFVWVDCNSSTKYLSNTTGIFSYYNASMPDGTYTARFYANDSVGNINSTNITFEIRTVLYTTLSLNKTTVMRGSSILIDGTIDDALDTPLDCAACLNITWGTALHSGLSVSSGAYNDTYTIQPSDTNLTIILNVSFAGNSGSNNTQLTINPAYTLNINCTENILNKNDNIICSADAYDIEATKITTGITIDFRLNENQSFNHTAASYPYTWTFSAPTQVGAYTIYANASDPSNNTGYSTAIITVRSLNLSLTKDIRVLNNKAQYEQSGTIFADDFTGSYTSNITIALNMTDEQYRTSNSANLTISLFAPDNTILWTQERETTTGLYSHNFNLTGFVPDDSGRYTVTINATDSQSITGTQNITFNISYWTAQIWYNTTLSPFLKGEKIYFNITTNYNSTLTAAPELEVQLRDHASNSVKYSSYPEDITSYSTGKYSGNFTTADIILGDYFLYTRLFQSTDTFAEDKHADITIGTDSTPPDFSGNTTYPASPASYTGDNRFNMTVTDNSGAINTAILEINSTNYTISTYRSINATHFEYYTSLSLTPGTYAYRWYANDSSGNMDTTAQSSYTVTKAQTSIRMYFNGTEGNRTYERGDTANMTAVLNISGKTLELWTDFTGAIQAVQNSTTPLANITDTSTLSTSTYNITSIFQGDANYTSSYRTYFLTIHDTQGPSISSINKTDPLECGASQNITSSASDLSGISTLWLEYDSINHSMLPSYWYSWTPLQAPGTNLNIIIHANDTNNNWNSVASSFTFQDTTDPAINSITITPQVSVLGDTIQINASVTDNYAIDKVWTEISTPSLNTTTVMLNTTYTTTRDGNHTVTVFANDTEGNTANTTAYFQVLNPANITLDPPAYSATISIGLSDTTNMTVNNTGDINATVSLHDDTSGWISYSTASFSLSAKSAVNVTLSITVPLGTVPGDYTQLVTANTTSGMDISTIYITVPDEQPPVINSFSYSNITFGQQETIVVNATDNKQVDKCTINHNSTNITMPGCTYTFTPQVTGTIQFTIYVNDTSGNANEATYSFTVTDITPPNITSRTINPKSIITSNNVSITMAASDNYALNYTWANITRPDQNSAVMLLPANYTTSQSGRHNITFYANDSSGNRANTTDYFIAEPTFILNGTVSNSNRSGIIANITVYFPDTEEIINSTQSTGNFTVNIPEYVYDIMLILANDTELKLNFVNVSGNMDRQITIDTPSVPEYLKTIAINTTYTYSNATIILIYNGTAYTNEDHLSISKCSLWNFTSEACSSSWQSYPNATQDKTGKKYQIRASTFSAYAINQDSYCGDSTCNNGESCSSCSADCGTCSVSSGTCKKGISFSLENKTVYENIPVNITLTITNYGTCTLYDSGISAEWDYNKLKSNLGDISGKDSINISLELDIPKSGQYNMSVGFFSQSYDADKTLAFYVRAPPSVQKPIPQPGVIDSDTTKNATQPTPENIPVENKTIQPKQPEKNTPSKEIPSAKPANYTLALVLIIVILIAAAIILWSHMAKTKNTNK